MQEEALLPRLFYMREWLTYGYAGLWGHAHIS